ncbi:MAG TPA: AAA family ATPase [Bryobacteraceae bacterium]|nr:AAA family ATPase [Bryobacteraceae bacterium]
MYEAFFGLREKPFSILPDPDLIYWGRMHSMAFTMLEFGVMNNAGFTVITGEIGCGKTTLLRHLLKMLNPNISVGLISNTPQGRDELLQWILMALGQPFEGTYPRLFKQLEDFLYSQYAAGRRTILIVDEAQNLGSEALEHLRMLSNINADKHQFLQVILIGQPQLRDLLLDPKLHQFAQRISSDFHLKPLDEHEVAKYIDFRLKAVGSVQPLFSPQACSEIARASGGIPRTINIICDTALVYGFASDQKTISLPLVQEVIADKQQFSIFPVRSTLQSC